MKNMYNIFFNKYTFTNTETIVACIKHEKHSNIVPSKYVTDSD